MCVLRLASGGGSQITKSYISRRSRRSSKTSAVTNSVRPGSRWFSITDRRAIPADSYFTGLFTTALAHGELITAVRFPIPKRAAYVKFAHRASKYALVGVFVAETAHGVRVAVTGAASHVFRATAYEAALATQLAPAALDGIAISAVDFNGDAEASADYRAHLVGVIARRAIQALA